MDNSKNWENQAIGEFLLQLNLNHILTPQNNWCVNKKILEKKFQEFLTVDSKKSRKFRYNLHARFQAIDNNLDIILFLTRTNYINNECKDSIIISHKRFCSYRDLVLRKNDVKKKRCKQFVSPYIQESLDADKIINDLEQLTLKEIDENAEWSALKYRGQARQVRLPDFVLKISLGCYICQCNFIDKDGYRMHVVYHNRKSNFEYLQTTELQISNVGLMYTVCDTSSRVCFKLNCDTVQFKVEKFIVVCDARLQYVPICEKGHVYVDWKHFSIGCEQPIIIVYHSKSDPTQRFVEQHHFHRTEPFPKFRNAFRKNTMKMVHKFEEYALPKNFLSTIEKQEFCQEKLSYESYIKVLRLLVQIEDANIVNAYKCLTIPKVKFDMPRRQQILKCKENKAHVKPVASDRVILKDTKNKKIYGCVEDVEKDIITISLEKPIEVNETYVVFFKTLRLNPRYQYAALDFVAKNFFSFRHFLFPDNLLRKLPSEIK